MTTAERSGKPRKFPGGTRHSRWSLPALPKSHDPILATRPANLLMDPKIVQAIASRHENRMSPLFAAGVD